MQMAEWSGALHPLTPRSLIQINLSIMRFFLILLLAAAPAYSAELSGPVTHIRDGDTVEISGIAVRFRGVNCPERGHQDGAYRH